tara:strand:- start:194 stop:1321 length:1128 start_codon:yes stop_codon:yes gene_type:complete
MANKVITAVQQLSNNAILDDTSNVVCIDTQYNRIGVKTSNPDYEIDVSGTIQTNSLYFKNNTNTHQITYDGNFLIFNDSIYINNDISVNNNIECTLLKTPNISSTNIDISDAIISKATITDLTSISINVTDISVTNILEVNTINSKDFANIISFSDCSLNSIKSIDCSSINNIVFTNEDTIFNGNHYTFEEDVSFNKNVNIDGSLNCNGDISINGITTDNGVFHNFTIRSDDRLKHNEKNIDNGLEIIRRLEPQLYQKTKNFKEIDFSGLVSDPYIIEAGLIAQEVEEINDLSFCVIKGNENTPYSLNYNNIFIYALAALKELDDKISTNVSLNKTNNLGNLEKFIQNQTLIIEKLNNKINILEKEINNLKNKKN